MKKLLTLSVLLSAVVLLTGCTAKPAVEETEEMAPEATVETVVAPEAAVEAVPVAPEAAVEAAPVAQPAADATAE